MRNGCAETVPPVGDLAEAKRRVELGAAMLTRGEGGPEWVHRIDLDDLNMGQGENCVGGQLHSGDWYDFLDAYPEMSHADSMRHGFDTREPTFEGHILLEHAWREKIIAMRAELV